MAKMQEFKCPCCGGSIEFDSSAQKMKCPFCDTEFDVKTLSEHAKAVEEEQPEDMNWSDEAGIFLKRLYSSSPISSILTKIWMRPVDRKSTRLNSSHT